ncbi:hypothetical protein BLNAU_12715 [Blattamonas nauphoetae]|uniref:Uncharacterized protein n=1 Tax=Blattamonas nauphoetae TaxID=2049346 RepID=A0ABQ9XJY1_9EUKA|nr:hypothetical protein BLNAU_12715 [Blattamonas nauphoetae]
MLRKTSSQSGCWKRKGSLEIGPRWSLLTTSRVHLLASLYKEMRLLFTKQVDHVMESMTHAQKLLSPNRRKWIFSGHSVEKNRKREMNMKKIRFLNQDSR